MHYLDWFVTADILLVAVLAPRYGDSFFRPIETFFSRLAARRFAAVAVFFGVIVVRLALLPLLPVPVPGAHDEFSYLLAADTFVHGRLANPPHPMWLSFETFHVNMFPAYASIFPPAQGFVLAIGQILGHPWIGVLLSNAAMCAAFFWMLQAWLPSRWALLGTLIAIMKLSIISYWMNSYWGGAIAACGGALVLGALPRVLRKPSLGLTLLMALGIAILANSRPYEGLVLCIPVSACLFWWLFRPACCPQAIKFRLVFLPLLVSMIFLFSFIGYYNWRTTGNPLLMPHILNSRTHPFASFVWQTISHPVDYNNAQFNSYYNGWARTEIFQRTWSDVPRYLNSKLNSLLRIFPWQGAVLLLLSVPLLIRGRRIRFLLLALPVSVIGALLTAWSNPHYLAPAICIVYALLAQSLRHLRTVRFRNRPIGLGLSRAFLLLLLCTWAGDLTLYISNPRERSWNTTFGIFDRDAVRAKLQAMPGKHLVIVRYGFGHSSFFEWVYNGADIDGSKIVWAREMDSEQNRKLLSYFHDRRVWLADLQQGTYQLRAYSSSDLDSTARQKP